MSVDPNASLTLDSNLRLCSEFFVTYYWNSSAEGVHFYSNVAVAASNISLSLLGVFCNVSILVAYVRNSRLRGLPHMLLATLASSDLLVTALVQPLYVVRILMETFGRHDCILWTSGRLASYYCCGVSVLTITIITIERYITLAYPYQRQVLLTSVRVKVALVSTWLAAFALVASHVVFLPYEIFLTTGATILLLCILTIISIWVWIHRLLCQHRKKIRSSQTPYSTRNAGRRHKKVFRNTKTSYIIVAAFLLCYLPVLLMLGYFSTRQTDFVLIFVVGGWLDTLMFANSLVNPVLVFWRQRDFKQTVKQFRIFQRE